MKKRWLSFGLILLVLSIAILLGLALFFMSEHLGYNTLGQRVNFLIQAMLLVIAILFAPMMFWGVKRLFTRERIKVGKLNPEEKVRTIEEKPKSEYEKITAECRFRFGWFWKYKIKKIVVIGTTLNVEKALPGLVAQKWLIAERTLFVYGGDLKQDIEVLKIKELRRCLGRWLFKSKPIDAMSWVIEDEEFEPNPKRKIDLERMAYHRRQYNKTLKWDAPFYIIALSTLKQDLDRSSHQFEEAVGIYFNTNSKLAISEQSEVLLNQLCHDTCIEGMQSAM